MNVTGGLNKGMNDTVSSHFRLGGKNLPSQVTESKRSISQLFAAEGVLFQSGSIKTLPIKDKKIQAAVSQREILQSQHPMQQIMNAHQEKHTRSSLNLGYGKLPLKNKSLRNNEYMITDQDSV
jgi:hypothetical protein